MIFKPGGNIHVLNAAGIYLLKVNSKDTRTKATDAVAVSFGVS